MPSKLPVIKANTTPENISKMAVIAKANKRSVAKELEWLIERHIAEYEKENGEIKTLVTITTDKKSSFAQKTIDSFNVGMEFGAGRKDLNSTETNIEQVRRKTTERHTSGI